MSTLLIALILGLFAVVTIMGSAGMMPVTKQRPFFSGQLTTVDGSLVEEIIDCGILNNQMRVAQQSGNKIYGNTKGATKLLVPKITEIEVEFAGGANMLDSVGDRLDITITPTHQTTHPHINDRELLFRTSIYQQLATAATNDAIGQFHLTKKWAVKDAIIVTSRIHLQVTLYGAAQIMYYRIYYTWEEIDVNALAMTIFNQGIVNT